MIVHLADDAWTDIVAPIEQLLLDLIFNDLAALFDDENFFKADRKLPHAFRLKRPRHPDLVEPQADLGGDVRRDAEFTQSLTNVLVALARGHDAVPRVRRIHRDAVDLVGAGEGNRGKALVILEAFILRVTVVRPAQIETARRHLEIGRNDKRCHLVVEIDFRRGFDRLGDDLHTDPAAGIARHRNTEQPHLDHLVDARWIKIRHQRRDKRMVGLMRYGRRLGAVVVACKTQHTAVFGRPGRIAMAEYVTATVHTWPLAVPDAGDAIELRTG